MSISTKDLRDLFDEATKKASDAIGDAKIPDIGRRDDTPGFLYFSIGLLVGALAGGVIAFLMTPYNGEQARQKVQEQVDKVRKPREEYSAPIEPTNGTMLKSSAYERPSSV